MLIQFILDVIIVNHMFKLLTLYYARWNHKYTYLRWICCLYYHPFIMQACHHLQHTLKLIIRFYSVQVREI